MKHLLLLLVVSSIAVGMVGCKSGDEGDSAAVAAPSGTAGSGSAAPTNANKAGMASAQSVTPTLNNAAANDPRWKAGTMLKGGGK
jgi:hypothetical protein